MEQHDLLNNDLLISNTAQANLIASAKWGKFLAIVGFIGCGFMALGGIYMQSIMSSYSSLYTAGVTRYVGITYIIMAVILIFPCMYLNKFSNNIQEAVRSSNQESVESAFMNLKGMFKFYGIFTIVILIFVALAFLGTISAFMR